MHAILSYTGIDYGGAEFLSVTINEKIYPVFKIIQYIKFPAMLFVFTTLISIYPARYAAKITPSKAMRKSF